MSLAVEADQELLEPDTLRRHLGNLTEAVSDKVPEPRINAIYKKLVPRWATPGHEETLCLAFFTMEIALNASGPDGRTAFDRHVRRHREELRAELLEAYAYQRQSRFMAIRVTQVDGDGAVTGADALSGEAIAIRPMLGTPDVGAIVAGRLARRPDGWYLPAGLVVTLPDTVFFQAKVPLSRDGTAFRNAERAAEQLCSALITSVAVADRSLFEFVLDTPLLDPQEQITYRDGRLELPADAPQFIQDVTAMAHAWCERGVRRPDQADCGDVAWLRGGADAAVAYSMAALAVHVPADAPLAEAMDAMLEVMVDTLDRRMAAGLGDPEVDDLNIVPETVAAIPDARERVERLRARAAAARGGTSGQGAELDAVIARIRALQAKTQEAGCTEAEAMAAAEKAAELLRRYDITLEPERVAEQSCRAVRIPTPRKRREGLDFCAPAIARFCDCRHWVDQDAEGVLDHVFFGLPADVAAAQALYAVLQDTFETETEAFKRSSTYRATASAHRGQATRSFRAGLASGICEKLQDLREARVRQTRGEGGRDLVPVKDAAIAEDMARLGLQTTSILNRAKTYHIEAYSAGVTSGRAFEPDPALAAQAAE